MEELEVKQPKKSGKIIKLIGGIAGIVILIVLFVVFATSSKHVTCVTFLGNDLYITCKNGVPQLSEIEESQLKRPGYKFVAWYQDNKFMNEYEENETFSGKNLYAKYERVIYTIEYLDENDKTIKSTKFQDETNYTVSEGTLIKVWTPSEFCVKNQYMDNTKKYGELINSGRFDQDAAKSLGIYYNTETDHSTFLIISPLTESGFTGYEIYGKDSEGNLTKLETESEYNEEKKGCLIYKDIISDTEYTGIVLKPIFE